LLYIYGKYPVAMLLLLFCQLGLLVLLLLTRVKFLAHVNAFSHQKWNN